LYIKKEAKKKLTTIFENKVMCCVCGEKSYQTDYGSLSGKDLLLTRRAVGMSQARQDRLIKYITGFRKRSKSTKSNTWRNLDELFKEPQITVNVILSGGSEDVIKEVEYYRELFDIVKNKTRTPVMQLEKETCINNNRSNITDNRVTVNSWSVVLENTGKCMHCGNPSIPGDYVCLQCNPG